jgi:hypothetical protein
MAKENGKKKLLNTLCSLCGLMTKGPLVIEWTTVPLRLPV